MANQYRSVLASSGPAPTGGDALPAEVLSGKTFTNDNGAQTGTMTNNGAVSQTISAGQSYTIPEGYHDGNGTVSARALNIVGVYSLAARQYTDEVISSIQTGDLVLVKQSTQSGYTYTDMTDVTSDYNIDVGTGDHEIAYTHVLKVTGSAPKFSTPAGGSINVIWVLR